MNLIADKTIKEAAQVITELLTRYHGEIDKALKASESGKVKNQPPDLTAGEFKG